MHPFHLSSKFLLFSHPHTAFLFLQTVLTDFFCSDYSLRTFSPSCVRAAHTSIKCCKQKSENSLEQTASICIEILRALFATLDPAFCVPVCLVSAFSTQNPHPYFLSLCFVLQHSGSLAATTSTEPPPIFLVSVLCTAAYWKSRYHHH